MLNRFISGFLSKFFKLLYHQFAWSYDWIAAYCVDWALEDLGICSATIPRGEAWSWNSVVVQVTYRLPTHPVMSSMYGLDASPQMLHQASRNLSKSNREKNLVLGVAQDLPFRDYSFPTVVSTFPSDYIFDPQTLSQIWRVLHDDGQLIILPAAWISGSNILDRFAAWLFTVTGESPPGEGDDLEGKFGQQLRDIIQGGISGSPRTSRDQGQPGTRDSRLQKPVYCLIISSYLRVK